MDDINRIEGEKGDLQEKLHATLDKAKELYERMQEQTTAAAKAADKAVREHPYPSLGIVFGLGVLVGLLLSRGRRD